MPMARSFGVWPIECGLDDPIVGWFSEMPTLDASKSVIKLTSQLTWCPMR